MLWSCQASLERSVNKIIFTVTEHTSRIFHNSLTCSYFVFLLSLFKCYKVTLGCVFFFFLYSPINFWPSFLTVWFLGLQIHFTYVEQGKGIQVCTVLRSVGRGSRTLKMREQTFICSLRQHTDIVPTRCFTQIIAFTGVTVCVLVLQQHE